MLAKVTIFKVSTFTYMEHDLGCGIGNRNISNYNIVTIYTSNSKS